MVKRFVARTFSLRLSCVYFVELYRREFNLVLVWIYNFVIIILRKLKVYAYEHNCILRRLKVRVTN